MKVLIADDDPDIRGLLCDYLQAEGFSTHLAENGRYALAAFREKGADLVILDVMMPEIDGLEVCRSIRQLSSVPIIFLTGKDDEVDQLLGFGFGADDYVTKPFSPRTLIARIKALLRRATNEARSNQPETLTFGELVLNLAAFTLRLAGNEIPLTTKEFLLLRYFAQHPNKVLTKRQLVTGAWGEEYFGDDSALMVHLSHLRQKLGEEANKPLWLHTVRGVGYKFSAPGGTQQWVG